MDESEKTTLLETSQLSRKFGTFQALSPIDLQLFEGEIVALEGPNGAGKSTLLMCLSGLMRPTNGQITVEGFDLYGEEVEAKKRLVFVPDVPRFYTELTAWEHLQFVAQAHRVLEGFEERAEKLMRQYGLWDVRDGYPHHFSRGMRLKLGLLMAFIRPFRVLLLDEPTSALDPESTALLAEHLKDIRRDGCAILLSSHHPQFTQQVADRVWTLKNGVLEGV